MWKLIIFLLLSACAFAQGIGGTAGVGGTAGFGGGASAVVAVGFDTTNAANGGSSNNLTTTITVAANSNNALLVIACRQDTGHTVSSVTSSVGTPSCAKVGSTQAGSTSISAEVWGCTGISTGAQTITVNYSGTVTTGLANFVYSLFNVNQTTPFNNITSATTGNVVVTSTSGDMTVSAEMDTAANRTISGCTTTRENVAITSYGTQSAHCTDNPTSTFTWSAISGIAVGVNAQHQ